MANKKYLDLSFLYKYEKIKYVELWDKTIICFDKNKDDFDAKKINKILDASIHRIKTNKRVIIHPESARREYEKLNK